jgi:uncharacterized protein YjeT (DUF2065 family)
MEVGIERLAALAFIVTGLSHVAAPRAWTRFFINMRQQGEAAGLLNAYLHMPLGLLIVSFHWVWNGPGLLVTLVGWALTLKGILYFLWPERLAAIGLGHVSEENGWKFRVAGIFGVALGLAIGWIALRGGSPS